MRYITVILAFLSALNVFGAEPLRIYHEFSGLAQDTTVTIAGVVPATSSSIEIRAEFAEKGGYAKEKSCISLSWADELAENWRAEILFNEGGKDDIINSSHILINVYNNTDSNPVFSQKYYDAIKDLNGEFTIGIDMGRCDITLISGQSTVKELGTFCGVFNPSVPVELTIKGRLEISSIVREYMKDMVADLSTGITAESVAGLVAGKKQPVGIWKALDRNTDSRYALPGGRYTLAIVPADAQGEYDILYLEGAEVHSSSWTAGMRKGKLKPTAFKDHYDLIWYDSAMECIEYDATASVEQETILSLNFPLLKSTLRFVRQ